MTDESSEKVLAQVSGRVRDALQTLFGDASTSTVFSAPIAHGDDLIVTAAAWERAGGFGFGGGSDGKQEEAGGGGGGGGGNSVGRPVAVIRIRPDGVEVKPVIDVTKIGVTVALSALAVWRILRR